MKDQDDDMPMAQYRASEEKSKPNSDYLRKELERISNKGSNMSPSSSEKGREQLSSPESLAKPKLKYPFYIIFILGNELCERFAFYGMKAVLTLYFLEAFLWTESRATLIYHLFLIMSYFTPILGAMLADGYIGKFSTIFLMSLVYVGGLVLMTLSSIPPIGLSPVSGFLSGLFLVALGTGGIKPCVVSYGGDQFREGQERERESFFSIFYFCINAGSLISTFVTPILRSDVSCLGNEGCYPAAFGLPAALLSLAIVLFLLGRPFYRNVPLSGNILGRVVMCVSHAIYNRLRGRNKPKNGQKNQHWLDYASDTFEKSFVNDVKQIMPVLKMFLPLPIFWTLFDQKGSRWTLQANKMDGRVTDNFYWKPDQVQIFNPVLILILVPVFETLVFPTLKRFNINFRLLTRMVFGMFFAGIAFVVAGLLQMQLDATVPIPPVAGTAELRMFNALPCTVSAGVTGWSDSFKQKDIEAYQMWDAGVEKVNNKTTVNIRLDPSGWTTCGRAFQGAAGSTPKTHTIVEKGVHSIYLGAFNEAFNTKLVMDKKEKPKKGTGFVRMVVPFTLNSTSGEVTLINPDVSASTKGHRYTVVLDRGTAFFEEGSTVADASLPEVLHGKYEVYVADQYALYGKRRVGSERLLVENGGVYTVILKDPEGLQDSEKKAPWAVHAIVPASSINIFWQLPQYFIITLGEVLFSVSGLAFAYSQSPPSMKAVLQAGWLMTTAFGNVITIIIAGAKITENQAVEFFIFAGLIGAFGILFAFMVRFYTYVEPSKKQDSDNEPVTKMQEIDEAVDE